MTKPGIEIRWGKSMNRLAQRQRLRPILSAGLHLAVEGVEQLGMTVTDKKYAYFHVARGSHDFGEASTVKTMHFYLDHRERHGNLPVGYMASKGSHELVHQLRDERVAFRTIGDWAASEAVAWHAEYIVKKQLGRLAWAEASVVETVAGQDNGGLLDALGRDFYAPLEDNSAVNRWRRWRSDIGARQIDIAGIAALSEQFGLGNTAPGVWYLPSEEVLGYEPVETAA